MHWRWLEQKAQLTMQSGLATLVLPAVYLTGALRLHVCMRACVCACVRFGEPPPTCDAGALGAVALLHLLILLEAGKGQHAVSHPAVGHLLNEPVRQLALGPKAGRTQGQCLLGLWASG